MISRRRFIGVFFQGMRRTGRSLSTALRRLLGASSVLSSIANWSACKSTRTTWLRMRSRSSLFCGILEMLADGGCDERLDLGRRHPAHGSGTPGLPMEQG